MISDFNFIGFTPLEETRRKANLATERLLEMAPYGSIAVALLQRDDISFRCAIEIYSKHGPFTARASESNPDGALEKAVRSLSKKLEQWKGLRNPSQKTRSMSPENSFA